MREGRSAAAAANPQKQAAKPAKENQLAKAHTTATLVTAAILAILAIYAAATTLLPTSV